MHIIIEDQETGERSILCVAREARHAQILALNDEHEAVMIAIAQSLGVAQVVIAALGECGERLQGLGFAVVPELAVYRKVF